MTYYPINEDLARRAKEMNSFSEYVLGSATEEYRRSVDEAAAIAEQQKQKVDPIHHEKIDRLLDTYARKLAENINRSNEIAARVPSILISGGGNFPVRKKEKQNQAMDANMEEWRQIQGLLEKIRSTGKGGISADDPEAVNKLRVKLEKLEEFQLTMRSVNAYYRKHKTLDGCPDLSAEDIEELKAKMARSWRANPKPYESYTLANNNATIRQTKARIEELKKQAETEYAGWAFDGGEVKMDKATNRLQVFFDEKPDRDTCSAMRHNGFRWAPSVGAWQRQLTNNAIYAAKHMDCLRPLAVEPPTQAEPVQEPPQVAGTGWRFYIIADLKTWADNDENRSPLEHFGSFEAAKARFEALRGEGYNSEAAEPGPDGQPPARLALGLESADGMSAADILHVRQGKNYLVTDFVRMERVRDDPAAMEFLSRVAREIGFDFVRVYEQVGDRLQLRPNVPFAVWDNPYFPTPTPGSIAAQYYELLHLCQPSLRDEVNRNRQVEAVVQYLLEQRPVAIEQLFRAVGQLAEDVPNDAAIQERLSVLTRELTLYDAMGRENSPPQKAAHKKSRER